MKRFVLVSVYGLAALAAAHDAVRSNTHVEVYYHRYADNAHELPLMAAFARTQLARLNEYLPQMARNADALDADLRDVEVLVLSHGHSDHITDAAAVRAKRGLGAWPCARGA